MADTQYGKPLVVGNFTDTAARGLTRIRFERGADDRVNYNEKWLQKLISRYPNVLPIEQRNSLDDRPAQKARREQTAGHSNRV
jgi:hypothetical protein